MATYRPVKFFNSQNAIPYYYQTVMFSQFLESAIQFACAFFINTLILRTKLRIIIQHSSFYFILKFLLIVPDYLSL